MEIVVLFGIIAFLAGMFIRSLFSSQRPPQVIYLQTEPVAASGGGGCLSILLVGALILVVLLAAGGA
jgi:hypothetical protein